MEYYDILHTIFGRDITYYLMKFIATSNFHRLLMKYNINPYKFSEKLKKYNCVVAGSALLSCYHKFKVKHINVYGDNSYPFKNYLGYKVHPFVCWILQTVKRGMILQHGEFYELQELKEGIEINKSIIDIRIPELFYNVIELNKKEEKVHEITKFKTLKIKFNMVSPLSSFEKIIDSRLQRDWLVSYCFKMDICKIVYNGDVVEPISGNIYDAIVKKQICNNIDPTICYNNITTVNDLVNDLHNGVMSMERVLEHLVFMSSYGARYIKRYHRRGFYIIFIIGDNKFIMNPPHVKK